MELEARRLLVVNGKGGCGKTTIATNLAAAYAHLGHGVVLIDHDSQASSSQWLQHRPPSLPRVHLLEAHRRTRMYTTRAFQQRLPPAADRIVIDTPSAVGDLELDSLLRGVDAVIVPMLPSSIDIRAGTRFLAQLREHRAYRAHPVPIGVVANRVRKSTLTHSKLLHFLECLDVPAIATFRDSALYTRLAEAGTGVYDVEADAMVERERRQWHRLLEWVDAATHAACADGRARMARGPRPAGAHARLDRSAVAQ
jgi:chromosome partitioning protein